MDRIRNHFISKINCILHTLSETQLNAIYDALYRLSKEDHNERENNSAYK